jgi:CHAT domain-containing protein
VLVNPKQDPAPLAREIYDVVLGRAQSDVAFATARTLLWSFDGVLRYVPAAALNNGQSYLVERYRNVVFNRASIDSLLDTPASQFSGIGLGVARQIAPYQPLPAVEEELDGIFASGGSVPGRVLLDASFTEPALEQALQGGNPVVHIATHFQLSPSDADNSLLLLGDGNLLNVGEIRQIKGGFRGVDLLTLSACDTAASGPTADGREVECFGTIAQEEGAKSVIASLWPVSDRSTSLLMQSFYRMRAANPTATKAEVFREAQIALVKGTLAIPPASGSSRILVHGEAPAVAGQPAYTPDPNAPFAHPYYWAPFLMIGNFR